MHHTTEREDAGYRLPIHPIMTPEHGAPLRLRIEDQLGYQMVKWIHTLEFVED